MKKEKWQQLGHLTAGLITMVHGFDSFEQSDYKSAVLYLSISVFFIVIAGLHKKVVSQFMAGDVAFFSLEAAAIFYSGWHYNNNGHQYIYYAMTAAAVLFIAFAILSTKLAGDRPKRRSSHVHKKRKRRSSTSSSSQVLSSLHPDPLLVNKDLSS